jgi:hypothetical protein
MKSNPTYRGVEPWEMYDLLDNAGLVQKMASYMKELCKAEAAISRFLDPTKTEMLFLTGKPKR